MRFSRFNVNEVMMKALTLTFFAFIFSLISFVAEAQVTDLIRLEFRPSLQKGFIEIEIYKKDNETIKLSRWVRETDSTFRIPPDAEISLTKEQFDSIENAIHRIRPEDILSNSNLFGLDGAGCNITFGGFSSSITYNVWSPDYDTKRRRLEDFLSAYELILKTANLNPKKIF